jgi:TonB family protein
MKSRWVAVLLSLALHGAVLLLVGGYQPRLSSNAEAPPPEAQVVFFRVAPVSPDAHGPAPAAAVPAAESQASLAQPQVDRQPAFMEAPPAPTAQEWALAANYTLKNSKRYRYAWGQQVRSMMGTAVEGPDQGVVRLRVEIAPDGRLARLQTLWTTSTVAEQLARQAIGNMPPLPPTPTGKPLVFDKTISFQPFDSGGPPLHENDCLPDPPRFRNPFVWDGQSPRVPTPAPTAEKPDPQAMEECLKQLAQDSVEAIGADMQRQWDRWGSGKLAR